MMLLTVYPLAWRLDRHPLALDALNRRFPPLRIADRAAVPPKREFIAVAVKMFLADVMKRADDSALQEREIAFSSVSVEPIGADVFAAGVIHADVFSVPGNGLAIRWQLVSHNAG